MNPDKSYPEIAKTMTVEAKQAALVALTDKFKYFRAIIEDGKKSAIDAVNMAREMGDTIIEFTGHQKLSIAEFNQLSLQLSGEGFAIGFAKECVSLSRQYKEPIAEYTQAKAVFDKLVVQMELLPKQERGEHRRHNGHAMEDLLAKVSKCRAELTAATKETPISKWDAFHRNYFLAEAKIIHDLYEDALKVAK